SVPGPAFHRGLEPGAFEAVDIGEDAVPIVQHHTSSLSPLPGTALRPLPLLFGPVAPFRKDGPSAFSPAAARSPFLIGVFPSAARVPGLSATRFSVGAAGFGLAASVGACSLAFAARRVSKSFFHAPTTEPSYSLLSVSVVFSPTGAEPWRATCGPGFTFLPFARSSSSFSKTAG